MKAKITIMALSLLLVMPCLLYAEEMEIHLMEVVEMGAIEGDNPLDGPDLHPNDPPRPNGFRATIDGNTLSITKEDETIPIAQAIVANASTGGIVLNQQFTNSLQEQIPNTGTYALRIETASGALVGQFIVQ